jgi:hypothetical protein
MQFDYQNFQKTLTYTATSSTGQIFQDLDAIAKLDQEAEKKKFRYTIVFALGLLCLFVSFFLISSVPEIAIILLISSVVAVIIGGIFMGRYGRVDVPNYRYELTRRIIYLLNRDLQENTNLHINLIFSPPTQKQKQISTGNHPSRRGWKVELFQDQWCSIEGEFSDRNRFQLILNEFHRIASGRNPRGKYKSKKKPKGGEVFLKLTCNQRQYGAIKILKQDAQGAIKLPDRVKIKGLNITDKAILLRVNVPSEIWNNQDVMYQTITLMFLSLYQVLNLARMLSQKKKA